jgi:dsRNA-specific ribonuclease
MALKDRHSPVALVAAKTDLVGAERAVTEAEGKELAKQLLVPYFETSAKEETATAMAGVENVFMSLVGAVVAHRGVPKSASARRVSGHHVQTSSPKQAKGEGEEEEEDEEPGASDGPTIVEVEPQQS